MKIYTKTGDAGETGLFGGPRVTKDHARIEAFGTVDELNSHLGVIRTLPVAADFDPLLRRIQCEPFDLGAQLATPGAVEERITSSGRSTRSRRRSSRSPASSCPPARRWPRRSTWPAPSAGGPSGGW